MAVGMHIQNGRGDGSLALVNEFGELAVGAPQYDSVSSVKLDVVNTAYNLVEARGDAYIIVTGLVLTANKSVGANDAIIQVYSTVEGATSRTQDVSLVITELATRSSIVIPSRIIVDPGKWINAETDDDDVFCSLTYYYINVRDVDQRRDNLSP
jgi:hypothetical protein